MQARWSSSSWVDEGIGELTVGWIDMAKGLGVFRALQLHSLSLDRSCQVVIQMNLCAVRSGLAACFIAHLTL